MHIVDAPPWFETPRGARLLTMRERPHQPYREI